MWNAHTFHVPPKPIFYDIMKFDSCIKMTYDQRPQCRFRFLKATRNVLFKFIGRVLCSLMTGDACRITIQWIDFLIEYDGMRHCHCSSIIHYVIYFISMVSLIECKQTISMANRLMYQKQDEWISVHELFVSFPISMETRCENCRFSHDVFHLSAQFRIGMTFIKILRRNFKINQTQHFGRHTE